MCPCTTMRIMCAHRPWTSIKASFSAASVLHCGPMKPSTQPHQQLLIMLKGHPGCGKSTLGRKLCTELKYPLIDKDDARDCFPQSPYQGANPVDWNAMSYEVMFQFCQTQLSLGLTVVVDCPLARPELYRRAAALAEQHGATLVVVECSMADECVWRQRLEARAQQIADTSCAHKPASWTQLQQLLDRYQGCWRWSTDGSVELAHHCLVDTGELTPAAACQHVLQWLHDRRLLASVPAQLQVLA